VGFEYNSACVYGRAVEGLKNSQRPDAEQLRNEYQAAGLRHLKSSMLLGFSSIDFIKNDPDLAVFHDVPEYQELLANPPSPGEEEEDGGEFDRPDEFQTLQ
jgi:hypothetical protein